MSWFSIRTAASSLTAHIRRALDMYARLRRAREHAQVERVLLDRLDIAALALDADRRGQGDRTRDQGHLRAQSGKGFGDGIALFASNVQP